MSLAIGDDVQATEPPTQSQPLGLCPLCDRYIPMVPAMTSDGPLLDDQHRPVLTIPPHVAPEPPAREYEPLSPLRGAPFYYDDPDDTAGLVAAGSSLVAH